MENNRQKQVIEFISKYTKENGYPPTMREIGVFVGVSSSSTIYKVLRKYHDDGTIVITEGISRGIKVTPAGKKLLSK